MFSSLCLVPPLALLAYSLARVRGFNPDRPQWSERYTAQGMSHAMGKEKT
jgi:fructoselysine-6-P-deglycase FrlB-like protein